MMSRASRMLKWVGAVTVLLAAAPIAYAEPVPATPSGPASSAWCGGGPDDFAGIYTVAGLTDARYRFDLAAMRVTQMYIGESVAPGTWAAGGGDISWHVDGLTYASKPGATDCADPGSASRVTAFTAGTADGADTLTLQRP